MISRKRQFFIGGVLVPTFGSVIRDGASDCGRASLSVLEPRNLSHFVWLRSNVFSHFQPQPPSSGSAGSLFRCRRCRARRGTVPIKSGRARRGGDRFGKEPKCWSIVQLPHPRIEDRSTQCGAAKFVL